MNNPNPNPRPKRHNEKTESRQRSDDVAGQNLDDYPIEVLEAVLTILKFRSKGNP